MKKFIMCVMICVTLQAKGLPKAQGNIDYKSRYEISYKYKQKKSVRKIIREILNRKKIDRLPNNNNMIPIPMYDSIKPNTLKDVA